MVRLNTVQRQHDFHALRPGTGQAHWNPDVDLIEAGEVRLRADVEHGRGLAADGKERLSQTNALGQLTDVWEITAADSATESVSFPGHAEVTAGYRSKYVYDALSNLTTVTQQIGTGGTTQTRSFAYDSLKRLTSATNPESGAITYQYDNNSNLTSKTDARSIITTINYDALNRVKTKTYSDSTPAVNYYYDSQTLPTGAPSYSRGSSTGREVAVTYSGGSVGNYYGYDVLGRETVKYQRISTTNYQVQAGYNLASEMMSETYPSGRTVSYSYDVAGRWSTFSGTLGDGLSRTYARVTQYNAAGLKERESYGVNALGNPDGMTVPLYLKLHYNHRLQMVDLRLGSVNDEWNWNRGALIFYYGTNAISYWNPFQDDTDNNGNVRRALNYVPKDDAISAYAVTMLHDYSYDSLNRVTSLGEAQMTEAGTWNFNVVTQNFTYDRYGNRCVSSATGGVSNYCPSYNATSNRISSLTYDAVGNITTDGATGGTMTYDAENHMLTATNGGGGSYTYDGEGKRVKRQIAGQEWWYVYGIGGELLVEYLWTAPTTMKKEYGYRGGQLLVVWDNDKSGNERLKWLVTDHLGSTRMEADLSGGLGGMRRHDYAPFGEELSAGIRQNGGQGQYGYEPPASNVRQKFVGYERDNESGLDYAQARYYANAQGRFTSPDNFLNDTRTTDPASWNLYVYTRNNPLRYTDPTGEKIYAGDLDDYQQADLLRRLNYTYGCDHCTSVGTDGYIAVDTTGLNQTVLNAAQFLTDAINSTSYFAQVQVSDNDPNVAFGENRIRRGVVTYNGVRTNADLIVLDFADDRHVSGDERAAAAFLNTVFAHEVAHGYLNVHDPQDRGQTGPTVDAVNRITDALGVPRRAEYASDRRGEYWLSIRFQEQRIDRQGRPEVDRNGNPRMHDIYINWLRRNVGGRGIN